MPEDANRWPLERLRIVLLHELAHVKRRDCLTHVVAQLACALHWFNPLAWIAARHIRTERERACDDLVLACGTRGSGLRRGAARDRPRHARRPLPGAAGRRDARHGAPLAARGPADRDPRPEGAALRRLAGRGRSLAVAWSRCALPPLAAMQPWTVATAEATAVAAVAPAQRRRRVMPAPVRPGCSRQPTPQPRPCRIADDARTIRHRSRGDRAERSATQSRRKPAAARRPAVAGCRPGRDAGRRADRRGRLAGVVQGVVQGAVQGARCRAQRSARRKESARPPIRGWSRR